MLRPELALAALVLILFGWAYAPLAFVTLLIEAYRTAGVLVSPESIWLDAITAMAVAASTAYFFRQLSSVENWGSQRDFAVLGGCVVVLPLALAGIQIALDADPPTGARFVLAWLGAVAPMASMLPVGLKIAEWIRKPDREPFFAFFARGVDPLILTGQLSLIVVATVLIWIERAQGGQGRIYPMFIAVFWMALTSGLPAATIGFLTAEVLFVSVDSLVRTNGATLDQQLGATIMGMCALIAGGLVTARQDSEDKQRAQGEALKRQLAEMLVIRRLADSIIALRDENALYDLGAEAIGEQIDADQVWLLWIGEEAEEAEVRGFWASCSQMGADLYSPDLCSSRLMAVWKELRRTRSWLLSRANFPNAILARYGLDVPLHQASGIRSLVMHPFSLGAPGFYVAVILSYQRLRQWSGEDLQFVAAVGDQITIALQKTRLLGEREERSRGFARMTQALVAETGETFFRNLVLRLSESTRCRGAYACRFDITANQATMIAFADSGRVRKEFKFALEGTPVEATLREGSTTIVDKAAEVFPKFSRITGVDVRGFASMRLTDSRGDPLGTLAIYDDRPLEDPDHAASVLRLFAARASTEIERSERERLLRESEERYRRLLETAHEGIWIVDEEGRTTYVNIGMASMLGYSPHDMANRSILDYVDSEDRTKIALGLQGRAAGAATQKDFRFQRHDGSFVWTMLSMNPIRDEDGQFRGFLAMVTDISERKRTEQELDRLVHERTAELLASNRELEAFCYSISHDLRQPLRAIDGFSRAAVEDLGDDVPDGVRDHLFRVRRAANRMAELIDALLTLSRLNRVEMKREKVDLSEVAESIIADLVKSEPERSRGYSVRKGLAAEGDARLLHIAMENLIHNAWKFSSRQQEPFVEVGSKKVGGKQCFYVRDNGIGFDMAYSGKLFKPFERLHSESEFYGTGIGLATVARVIARHGGQIWAEGEEGKGATFYFTL